MRYWWDKIKVITENLNLWDNVQALGFDTCWFLLLGKWNDTYGNIWDTLTATTEACYDPGECPVCQTKIKDVMDLPWWPDPCSSGRSFLMLDKWKNLITVCEDSVLDKDEKVKVSNWDETAGYLADKLVACDPDWPIVIRENASGSYHTLCVGFDPEKSNLKFTDLKDTPGELDSWIVVSDGNSLDVFKPEACPGAKYSYIIYNTETNSIWSQCPVDTSTAQRSNIAEYHFSMNRWTEQEFIVWCNSVNRALMATDDILTGDNTCLFKLTRPGIYYISSTMTLHNDTNAGVLAIRAGTTVQWWNYSSSSPSAMWDFKYEARRWSNYVNDQYPQVKTLYEDRSRELDFRIMSFTWAYVLPVLMASPSNPVKIWYHIKIDGRCSDPRYEIMDGSWNKLAHPNTVDFHITNGTAADGDSMRVTATRIWEIPSHYTPR